MDNAAIAYAIGALLFLTFGIKLGAFTPRGIGLFLLCGVIVAAVVASGFTLVFIVAGAIVVLSLMIFLAVAYGHESPKVGMNNGNDVPCDPNWKSAIHKPGARF